MDAIPLLAALHSFHPLGHPIQRRLDRFWQRLFHHLLLREPIVPGGPSMIREGLPVYALTFRPENNSDSAVERSCRRPEEPAFSWPETGQAAEQYGHARPAQGPKS